jgi:hypothetical protein
LRYTDLLCSYPGNIEHSDLDALGEHFNQEQVIELALTIATGCRCRSGKRSDSVLGRKVMQVCNLAHRRLL